MFTAYKNQGELTIIFPFPPPSFSTSEILKAATEPVRSKENTNSHFFPFFSFQLPPFAPSSFILIFKILNGSNVGSMEP